MIRQAPTPLVQSADHDVSVDAPARIVWCFFDGKRGHENQARGLLAALRRRLPLDVHYLPAYSQTRALRHWLSGRFPLGQLLPSPDVIIGAGHGTHLPMLAARRAHGGRAVVLMKPSLPHRLFDLSVIPEHDGVFASEQVFVSRGALSSVWTLRSMDAERGLILLGGPSHHYDWSDESVIRQIETIVSRSEGPWTVGTSRRTPPSFPQRFRQSGLLDRNLSGSQTGRLEFVPWTETTSEWLPRQLAVSARVWVTEDSVSMVYDGLTAGLSVGLIDVPRLRNSRVARGMDRLVQDGVVTPYRDWMAGTLLEPPEQPFNEAKRCADWIVSRWFNGR